MRINLTFIIFVFIGISACSTKKQIEPAKCNRNVLIAQYFPSNRCTFIANIKVPSGSAHPRTWSNTEDHYQCGLRLLTEKAQTMGGNYIKHNKKHCESDLNGSVYYCPNLEYEFNQIQAKENRCEQVSRSCAKTTHKHPHN